ncbi:hypothetical protein HYQ45_017391 [Verticillium longisporum]|uniref:Phospholipid/glycerol acyltransferase domain-containing protein n=1 Tax=Verticillium longisporum TaxID=100787 RepID=A0A8I3AHB1_VERLO|nr:hypothetical protein HYQ45_017391 [Verticillium longisporum]RBQ72718.1 hypothetical protein VDGD_04621 [Verticillium dahliae]
MEKFSQFRDKGSGISPFVPIKTPVSPLTYALHTSLFLLRLPLFLTLTATYFLFLHHLPLPVVVRKALLWSLMAIPGLWWIDLQLDGVRRGTLADQPPSRFPHPASVIASTLTSPIDALYLAAIFDPIFTRAYPSTRKLERVSLLSALAAALGPVRQTPPPGATLYDLDALLAAHPTRVIAVFPEAATTNGKAVLPLAPALLAAPADADIFPVSLRYTPGDVTTPVPGRWLPFLWALLSRPTICIRVRVAEAVRNGPRAQTNGAHARHDDSDVTRRGGGADGADGADVTMEEQRVLDKVAEALARLGRNKRVGLTLKDKAAFVDAWNRRTKR